MRRVVPPDFKFVYEKSGDGSGAERVYNRIFELARKKMELDNKSTKEYIDTYGGNRNIFDTGGSSQKNESGADYCLQNVSISEDTSGKVWGSMEDKSKGIDSIIKKERE